MEKKFSDLFAFDLDGTLVHPLSTSSRGVPQVLLDEVYKIAERAHIVVATGRRFRTSLPDLEVLPDMPYSVHHNGLVIKDQEGQTVLRHAMDLEMALQLGRLLNEARSEFFFAVDGHDENLDFIFLRDSLDRSEACRSVFQRTQGKNLVINNLEELSDALVVPLIEIAMVDKYESLLRSQKTLADLLPPPYRALVVKNIGYADFGALEIFPNTHSKWTGIEFVREKLGARRVIAVGDDENDVEMLRFSDFGVAMNHAEAHVRAVAREEVSGYEGLAKFLREFYLK